MKEWLRTRKKFIGSIVCALFLGSSVYLYARDEPEMELLPVTAVQAPAAGEQTATTSRKESPQNEPPASAVPVTVDVKGAVVRPGVYTMPPGSRVHEVVQQAGGLTQEADSRNLNGAKKLVDGMLVYVPRQGEKMPVSASGGESGDGNEGKPVVNLNMATSEQLQTIPGIGPAKAAAILEYREQKGPFKKVDELTNVSGIGPKTLEKIRSHITVE